MASGFNLRRIDADTISIALDETVTRADLETLAGLLGGSLSAAAPSIPAGLQRTSAFLAQAAALALPAVAAQLAGAAPKKVIVVPNRIVNVVA